MAYIGAADESVEKFEKSWRDLGSVPMKNLLLFCIFKISPKLYGLVPTWEFSQKIRWKFHTLFTKYRFKGETI
jgi:hypothetical protein